MERSEPSLVPEWLRSTGSVTGGGNSAHHFALSPLHSDVPSAANHARNKSNKTGGDFDNPRSAFIERTSSSNSRRSSSSNGVTKHPYSSFSRSHRDRDRDKEKDKSFLLDRWDPECSDPVSSILGVRAEKDRLRRSRSLVYGKQNDVLSQRVITDSKNHSNRNNKNKNGVTLGGSGVGSIQKAAFEKDFPSLGAEEKQGVPEVGRVSSPGLSSAVQNLPVASSTLIGGEGWTSALAEVPSIIGSSGSGSVSTHQTIGGSSVSGSSSTTTGLNMAEALAQAPSRTQTAPQLSVQTQRLEELARKQSRQLIPMTPSTFKASVLNSSDKVKPKPASRTTEMAVAGKTAQHQSSSSHLVSQATRGAAARTDTSKSSQVGKFLVLKPVWDNGVSTASKDAASPTSNGGGKVTSNPLAAAPVATSASLRSPIHSKPVERKATSSALNTGATVERRPSSSQAKSRNDFFNLMRKKSSITPSSAPGNSGSINPSPDTEKSGEVMEGIATVPANHDSMKNGGAFISNGNGFENAGSNLSPNSADLEEEEARFLRSLGWEEAADEDEGLTEEEINAFYECVKLRRSPKLIQGMESKVAMLHQSESHVSSSNSEAEA